ncbi:MAG: response regulator [Moraxellaceae bacterium]
MKESGAEKISLPEAATVRDRGVLLHILVVDDSAAVRQYMSAKLKQLAATSFQVSIDEAASGEEAVECVRHKSYDLVFLDVVMPGMGGHEACRQIKAIRKTRVAMLSSLKSGSDHHEGHLAGCDNYLTKPPQDVDVQSVLRIVYLRKSIAPVSASIAAAEDRK